MNIIKMIKWSAAHIAWLTMAWSPVALGAEAEKISKQKLTQYIQEFGLNKKTTLGEFWEKSKVYYPGYVYKEIESFVQQNRNLEMPEVIISGVKGTDGNEIPTLQLSANGRVQSIQFFGEKQKWAKFNNAILSESNLQRPDDMFKRVQANDIRLQKEAEMLEKKYQANNADRVKNKSVQQKDFARFNGFPRMTPQLWKSLTPVQRTQFFVTMRLMWRDAQKVLDSVQVTGSRRNQQPSTVEYFLKSLFGDDANALETDLTVGQGNATAETASGFREVKSAPVTIKAPPRVFDANSCIVAGYVGVYDKVDNNRGKNRQGCSVEKAIESYKVREILGSTDSIKQANEKCSSTNSNMVACNPIIYGFPGGKPACVNKEDPSFQTATHYKGACDSQSPLMSTKEPLFQDKDYSKIMPREKQIAIIEADQERQKNNLTKQFLNGVLAAKEDKSLLDAFQKGIWSPELDNELVRIQTAFEEEINGAIKTCEADTLHKNEVNQKGACDQLHRRWLFAEKFLNPLRPLACSKGTIYVNPDKKLKELDGTSLVCQCVSDNKVKLPISKFGGACPSVGLPATEAKDVPVVEQSCPSGTKLLQGGDENKCVCLNNKDKILPQSTAPEKVGELCEEKSNLWKWLLGGLGLLALFALFNRSKKNQPIIPPNPPPLCDANKKLDGGACVCAAACPGSSQNPVSCACAVPPVVVQPLLCPPHKTGNPPFCECPGSITCASGQAIFDQASCQCVIKRIDPPPQVVCPNNSRPKDNNLASCPTCKNGLPEPAGGCPKPKEGGTVENPKCTQGKECLGGVPKK